MAILNKIRQRSLVLILVIAMALFAFVLADLFRNSDALSSKSQYVVATVNGEDISREDFMNQVKLMQRQLGPNVTNTQAMNRVYDQEVRKAVLNTQYNELGLSVERDQTRELVKKALATYPEFQNADGIFDENKLNEFIANLKDIAPESGTIGGAPITYNGWIDYENRLAQSALQQMYYNLIKAGTVGTLSEGELEHRLEGDKVDVSYVQVPFSSIADSTVVVTDAEVKDYMAKHSKQFEVEETRDVAFVQFKEVASEADENAIKATLINLLNGVKDNPTTATIDETVLGFGARTDNQAFIDANSDIKFNDSFVFKSSLPKTAADSIYALKVGGVFGPYKDAGYYKLSKIVAETKMPDSVQARHILIPFAGSRSAGENPLTKEAAKAKADSLLAVFKTSKVNFGSIAKELSADTGSAAKDGDLGYFTSGRMVPTFNDFCFQGKTGDLGVVESVFGFHIIDITDQKNFQRAVKVGTIAQEIEPSEASNDKVFQDVSNFEIAVGKDDFQAVAKTNEYAVRPVKGLKILDENIIGLGAQRQIVRWAFEDGTSVGDVKRFNVPGGYVVVQVTASKEAGLMPLADAKITALPAIRKDKKAQQIMGRITATTVADVAAAEKQSKRTAKNLNMKNPTIAGVGREPKIVGAAFALKEGETSKLLQGDNGVYMIEVTKQNPAVSLENYQTFANQVGNRKATAVNSKLYNALKEAAEIEDNRANTVQ